MLKELGRKNQELRLDLDAKESYRVAALSRPLVPV
jgi:hypothetical protein